MVVSDTITMLCLFETIHSRSDDCVCHILFNQNYGIGIFEEHTFSRRFFSGAQNSKVPVRVFVTDVLCGVFLDSSPQ